MFVVIGNPPYNVGQQVNENDNNKNRKYETMDKRAAKGDVCHKTQKRQLTKYALYGPVRESDSLGIKTDWKRRRCCVCDEQRFSSMVIAF